MTRDMDLIRNILKACEDEPGGWAPEELQIEGYTDDHIGYHVMLMAHAGLVVGEDNTTLGSTGPYWRAQHLTWAGHEFLDAARNDTTWNKAKAAVGGVAGFSLEILKNVLVSYGTEQAKRALGQ